MTPQLVGSWIHTNNLMNLRSLLEVPGFITCKVKPWLSQAEPSQVIMPSDSNKLYKFWDYLCISVTQWAEGSHCSKMIVLSFSSFPASLSSFLNSLYLPLCSLLSLFSLLSSLQIFPVCPCVDGITTYTWPSRQGRTHLSLGQPQGWSLHEPWWPFPREASPCVAPGSGALGHIQNCPRKCCLQKETTLLRNWKTISRLGSTPPSSHTPYVALLDSVWGRKTSASHPRTWLGNSCAWDVSAHLLASYLVWNREIP